MPIHKWQPTQDISKKHLNYSDQDLRALEAEWQLVEADTPPDTLSRISQEINREWAIETGKIEGLYSLTRGMTETLINRGIHAKLISHSSTNKHPEWVAAILRDQQDVISQERSLRKLELLFYIIASHRFILSRMGRVESPGRWPR
jgi:hypothetical protein